MADNDKFTRTVCVKECPLTTFESLNCSINSVITTCEGTPFKILKWEDNKAPI